MKNSKVKKAPKVKAMPVKKTAIADVLAVAKGLIFADSIIHVEKDESALVAKAAAIEPNTFVACDRSDIPELICQRYLKVSKTDKPQPDVCGLFRDNGSELWLLLGYKGA